MLRKFHLYLLILVSFLFVSLFQGTPTYSDEPGECTFQVIWTKPTTGTPVDHYVVEVDINDTGYVEFSNACPDTFYFFTQPHGTSIKVKVAGVDAQNRQGPFSLPSLAMVFDCSVDDGSDGEEPVKVGTPGKPVHD